MRRIFPPFTVAFLLLLSVLFYSAAKVSFTDGEIVDDDQIASITIPSNLPQVPPGLIRPRPRAIPPVQPVQPPPPVQPERPRVNERHRQCIADAIYWEARGEGLLGQIAVARVVMNRIQHGFAGDPCAVVYQRQRIYNKASGTSHILCQFSWTCEKRGPVTDGAAMADALWIAWEVLAYNNWSEILPSNLLFFHSTGVRPGWRYSRYRRIGGHVFYTLGRPHYIVTAKTTL